MKTGIASTCAAFRAGTASAEAPGTMILIVVPNLQSLRHWLLRLDARLVTSELLYHRPKDTTHVDVRT